MEPPLNSALKAHLNSMCAGMIAANCKLCRSRAGGGENSVKMQVQNASAASLGFAGISLNGSPSSLNHHSRKLKPAIQIEYVIMDSFIK